MNDGLDDKTKYLLELKQSGELSKLYRYGIITPTVFKMLEVKLKVHELIEQGVKKSMAVARVSAMLGIHEKHCYYILRS